MDMPREVKLSATCYMMDLPQGEKGVESVRMRQNMRLDTVATTDAGMDVVIGLEVSEVTVPSADRPSLILRRIGEESLWDMAKYYSSTETAIREANGLTDEPVPGQILIIPVA